MKLLVLFVAVALAAVPFAAAAAAAAGEAQVLRLAPKEAIVTTLQGRHAPFVLEADDPTDLDFIPHPEARRGSPSSCNGESTLCYDPTNGHIVYKPARMLMPDIPGLQRENISVKRDRIIFRYSF